MPKVTVLLTSYNHADFISKSIDSILNQTFKDFELIIIDDCSNDDSWKIIKKYKDKRIKAIRNKTNKGSVMCKELVESFKGEYFAVAHCDDSWRKDKLEKQVSYLDNHSNIAACFTHVELIDEDDNKVSADNYVEFNVQNRSRTEWLKLFFDKGNCLCHPSILIRKNIQLERNLFSYGMVLLPDFYRWIKLCLTDEIYVYPEKLTYFRIRRSGINTSGYNYSGLLKIIFEKIKILELYKLLTTEDFFNVFPESKKYIKNDRINTKFILSKLCLNKKNDKSYKYFGISNIYDLFQNEKDRLEIEELYNYTLKDFIKDASNFDIFGVINEDILQDSSLFYNNGDEEYSEERKLFTKSLVNSKQHFDILWSNLDFDSTEIRIDPDEKIRAYEEIEIYVNNKKVEYETNASEIKNNVLYFYHNDPSFYVKTNEKINSVFIKGKVKKITINDTIEWGIKSEKERVKKTKLLYRIRSHFK